jgi:hypothetical protein
MYIDPDLDRLVELKGISPKTIGLQVMFCPRCDFQFEPGVFGKNECPGCRQALHLTTIDADLVQVVENGLF